MTKVTVAFREHANSPENKVKKGYNGHLKPLQLYLHIDLSAVTFVHIGKKSERKLQLNMPCVLIEGLFNDNVSSSDYVKYNRRICEERIGKDEEGGSRGQTLTATEANHKISREG